MKKVLKDRMISLGGVHEELRLAMFTKDFRKLKDETDRPTLKLFISSILEIYSIDKILKHFRIEEKYLKHHCGKLGVSLTQSISYKVHSKIIDNEFRSGDYLGNRDSEELVFLFNNYKVIEIAKFLDIKNRVELRRYLIQCKCKQLMDTYVSTTHSNKLYIALADYTTISAAVKLLKSGDKFLENHYKVTPAIVKAARYTYDVRVNPNRTAAQVSKPKTSEINNSDPTSISFILGDTYKIFKTLDMKKQKLALTKAISLYSKTEAQMHLNINIASFLALTRSLGIDTKSNCAFTKKLYGMTKPHAKSYIENGINIHGTLTAFGKAEGCSITTIRSAIKSLGMDSIREAKSKLAGYSSTKTKIVQDEKIVETKIVQDEKVVEAKIEKVVPVIKQEVKPIIEPKNKNNVHIDIADQLLDFNMGSTSHGKNVKAMLRAILDTLEDDLVYRYDFKVGKMNM